MLFKGLTSTILVMLCATLDELFQIKHPHY